ncbi:MAG: MinD/ParA family protein [Deltaproteobacteria bacterium]|nr:MinD/ParA family protein [Deltaproteobacteria bacterium]
MQEITRIKLWSIGGGKGGIGKSIFTLGLGISLSRLGKKVILIDADLGGANLHTLMGVHYPPVTLEDFLLKRVERLEDLIIPTEVEGIGLICGADDVLGAANPTFAQKIRLLKQMEGLDAHFVLLDLGAGTSFNFLDFFNYSPGKIVLTTNQATSLQNAYGFIKSALYRQLSREFSRDNDMLEMLFMMAGKPEYETPRSIRELLAYLKDAFPGEYARVVRVMAYMRVWLVVNMIKTHRDGNCARIIQEVCRDFLSLQLEVLGRVPYDSAVEAAVNNTNPFFLSQKKNKAMAAFQEIAERVLKESRLPRTAWVTEEELMEEKEPQEPAATAEYSSYYFW